MESKEIIKILDTLKAGDEIDITIYDCGTGPAKILEKTNTGIKIEIDKNIWANCYSCQTTVLTVFCVEPCDIYEISKR